MKYLAVIPARGGSKGIPKKNIALLQGKPLICYTLEWIERVKKSAEYLQMDVVVSTDSEEIATVVQQYEEVRVVMRPKEISGDSASTEAALVHALEDQKKETGNLYDAVITLQPTSPFRREKTFLQFLNQFEKDIEVYDALLSLHETRTDYWIKKDNMSYVRLNPQAPRRRQDREPMYVENSAYYVTKTETLYKTKSVLGTLVNGFVIEEEEGLDINTTLDLEMAGIILGKDNKG